MRHATERHATIVRLVVGSVINGAIESRRSRQDTRQYSEAAHKMTDGMWQYDKGSAACGRSHDHWTAVGRGDTAWLTGSVEVGRIACR